MPDYENTKQPGLFRSAFPRIRTKPKLVPLAVEEGPDRIDAEDSYRIGNGDTALNQCLFRGIGILHLQGKGPPTAKPIQAAHQSGGLRDEGGR